MPNLCLVYSNEMLVHSYPLIEIFERKSLVLRRNLLGMTVCQKEDQKT